MNRLQENSRLLKNPNFDRIEPIAKNAIRIDAASRLEALIWKLQINMLFVGAAISTADLSSP